MRLAKNTGTSFVYQYTTPAFSRPIAFNFIVHALQPIHFAMYIVTSYMKSTCSKLISLWITTRFNPLLPDREARRDRGFNVFASKPAACNSKHSYSSGNRFQPILLNKIATRSFAM